VYGGIEVERSEGQAEAVWFGTETGMTGVASRGEKAGGGRGSPYDPLVPYQAGSGSKVRNALVLKTLRISCS